MLKRNFFFEERESLLKKKSVNKNSSLYKLSPFLDDNGLLRVGGRLQMHTLFSFEEKHPIILPKCRFSYLLVESQHQLLKHAGVSTLVTVLRNKYWIFGIRVMAKKVCRLCIACQKQDTRACQQIMAPLPSDRISRSFPFAVVGTDHAGPLFCLDTGTKKYYILLFTCAAIRAVHLELVPAMSLDAFMLALRRFCARRGMPTIIYSDNAKTFDAASTLIKQLGPSAPKWKFSVPLAPWYGGWWERLVGSTKSALRKSLGKCSITRDELQTVLTEIEACVNSRPLTYLEEDKNPLTPSHFLLGRSSPYVTHEESDIPKTQREFSVMNKEQKIALDHFWSVWSQSYVKNLPSLGNGRGKRDLQEGSIVLIREDNRPRLRWPLGRVTEVFEGKDGLIRAVNLKTEKGVITRPVQRLHKLEISDVGVESENHSGVSESSEFSDETTESQPKNLVIPNEPPKSRYGRQIKPSKRFDM